ncbi:MAG: hypothetical protein FJW36_11285 [Acidobacteria bacterium]|nr:hypothetical protein [Acidobacteriota bacterium]
MRSLLLTALVSSLLAQDCRFTVLSPAQPPLRIEEGERATESQTFQTTVFGLSPSQVPHFLDTASRIRRITPNGRMITLAGNGTRATTLTDGPADQALPAVSQILFSPDGTLHFVALGRIFIIANNEIKTVAGTGRPGFNGESGPATQINLGGIVNTAFDSAGSLLIIDGFNRLRKLSPDGTLRTIAGSTRPAATTGLTGDEGPATEASLSNPRQVIPFPNGNIWLRDLGGRHIRLITPDGIIDTVNSNFDTAISILLLANGTPAASTTNRVFPLRADGNIELGAAPYPPFTGTPRAVAINGDLYFEGNARPDQRNPLVRISNRFQTVIAGAPVANTVDGQAPPFGIYYPRNNSLLYSATLGNKTGILETRPGQQPRFVVGGGDDIGDADGKTATALSLFGIQTFTIDNEGRIIFADTNRRRILIVDTAGKVSVLKTADGNEVIFAPLGGFSTLQRITTDQAGNIYWNSAAATPPGGVLTVNLAVFNKATSTITELTIPGLAALNRLEDGTAIAIAGNGANFRSILRLSPTAATPFGNLRLLPITSTSGNYFNAATRIFRGQPGNIEYLETVLTPDFITTGNNQVFVHFTDGGFYRLENPNACSWQPQPRVNAVTNAATFTYPNTYSPRSLLTLFGSGLGPAEGQSFILDGVLRAGGQAAPYPAIILGNFSGAIPQATLTGTTLPVIFSNDTQVTVAAPNSTTGTFQLYFTWQGLTLIQPFTVRYQPTTPGLFNATAQPDKDRLILYATGLGAISTNPALGDFLSTTQLHTTTNAVTATIDGKEATVEYSGGAPGQIGGLYQINLRLPEGITPGPHQVRITANEITSPPLTVILN